MKFKSFILILFYFSFALGSDPFDSDAEFRAFEVALAAALGEDFNLSLLEGAPLEGAPAEQSRLEQSDSEEIIIPEEEEEPEPDEDEKEKKTPSIVVHAKTAAAAPPPPPYKKLFRCDTTLSSKSGNYSCPKCNKCFIDESSIKRHEKHSCKKNAQLIMYKCLFCPEYLSTPDSCRRHMSSLHKNKDQNSFGCEECKKSFSAFFFLKRHSQKEHNVNLSKIFPQSIFENLTIPAGKQKILVNLKGTFSFV